VCINFENIYKSCISFTRKESNTFVYVMGEEDFASKEEIKKIFTKLQRRSANKKCFDCDSRNATWTSIPFGIFVCLNCSASHRNMGVHISFVKSSTLDQKWTYKQLRMMKCGGNDKFKDFLNKNGGSIYLTRPLKEKYTNQIAKNYKEKLEERAANDAIRHPDILEWDDGTTSEDDAAKASSSSTDDFFAKWESSSGSASATPSPLASTTNLSKKQGSTNNAANKPSGTGSLANKPKRGSLLRNGRKTRNILGGGAANRNKSRLHVKKVNADIDFDAFEQEAKKEEKEAKVLGVKSQIQEKKESSLDTTKKSETATRVSPLTLSKVGASGKGIRTSSVTDSTDGQQTEEPAVVETRQSFAKLGFGMTAASPSDGEKDTNRGRRAKDVKYTGNVAKRFGGQKSISSDQYYGINAFDKEKDREARERLKSFTGAQSISSSQYYGNNEDELEATNVEGGELEQRVAEIAQKYVGQDINVLKAALREQGEKVGKKLADYLRDAMR